MNILVAGALIQSAQARKFVQGFYNWYAPLAHREDRHENATQIVKSKRRLLEPRLWRALAADDRAQDRSPGEIVGIDFDPFEAGQDPEKSYQARAVVKRGANYWVDVWGSVSGPMTHKPCVVAIVTRRGGKWVFENFFYPSDHDSPATNLLNVLNLLARERAKTKTDGSHKKRSARKSY